MSEKEARYIELCWRLLEHKAAYYMPDKIHESWKESLIIPDADYDQLENEYREIAKYIGREPTSSDTVGFPSDSPTGKLIMAKLSAKKKGWRKRIKK